MSEGTYLILNVFDLDGTLIDSTHRMVFIDGEFSIEDWRKNSSDWSKVEQDKIINHMVEEAIKIVSEGNSWNIVVTSREMNEYDFDYLKQNNLLIFDDYIHRDDPIHLGEFYKFKGILNSQNLKKELLMKYMLENPFFTPGRAYDDDHGNREVFKELGFYSINPNNILSF